MLGAMMEAEYQSWVIAFIKGWAKSSAKATKPPKSAR